MEILKLINKAYIPGYVTMSTDKLIITQGVVDIGSLTIMNIENIPIEFLDDPLPKFNISFLFSNLSSIYKQYKDDLKEAKETSVQVQKPSFIENDMYASSIINNKFNSIFSLQYNEVYNENIKNNSTIERLTQIKASEGEVRLFINANNQVYPIFLFKGLIPINKSDKLNLAIYEPITDRSSTWFLSKFTLIKKDCNMDIYIKYRKLV